MDIHDMPDHDRDNCELCQKMQELAKKLGQPKIWLPKIAEDRRPRWGDIVVDNNGLSSEGTVRVGFSDLHRKAPEPAEVQPIDFGEEPWVIDIEWRDNLDHYNNSGEATIYRDEKRILAQVPEASKQISVNYSAISLEFNDGLSSRNSERVDTTLSASILHFVPDSSKIPTCKWFVPSVADLETGSVTPIDYPFDDVPSFRGCFNPIVSGDPDKVVPCNFAYNLDFGNCRYSEANTDPIQVRTEDSVVKVKLIGAAEPEAANEDQKITDSIRKRFRSYTKPDKDKTLLSKVLSDA